MNELMLQDIQTWLADRGAPEWLQSPAAWLGDRVRLGSSCPGASCDCCCSEAEGRRDRSRPVDPRADREAASSGAGPTPLRRRFRNRRRNARNSARAEAGGSVQPDRAGQRLCLPLSAARLSAGLCGHSGDLCAARANLEDHEAGGIVAAMLSIIPRLFVWYRRRPRLAQINGGLADMLDMLSMCLGGGMSISPASTTSPRTWPAIRPSPKSCRSCGGRPKSAACGWPWPIGPTASTRPKCGKSRRCSRAAITLGTSLSGSLLDQADHFRTARKQLATLQANRMPVFLTFPLLFCFAPAVLIILMSPGVPADLRIPQSGERQQPAGQQRNDQHGTSPTR